MDRSSERGSAIILLFIAVALFGMLAYAFLQGSRGNVSMMTSEATQVAVYQSQDCTNAVNMATKRLAARGCGAMISNATDGSNANPGAPADGSCSIYHPNGGGVKGDCAPPITPTDPCLTGSIGTACADGAFYIGDAGGNRIYAAPADESGSIMWSSDYTNATGATNATDGQSNNNNATIVAQGASIYPAIWACRNKATPGTWYLPANNELNLIWTNRMTIDLAAKGFNTSAAGRYWSSTESANYGAWILPLNTGSMYSGYSKSNNFRIRCVRR